jgi:hypothetical protein
MRGQWMPFHALVENGWTLDSTKGMETKKQTSVSLCFMRDGKQIACVQGYGRTRTEALADATEHANEWIKAHPKEYGSGRGLG